MRPIACVLAIVLGLTAGAALAESPTPTATPAVWEVGHQLIIGMPWWSEKESEPSLKEQLKDAESTPDQRLVGVLNALAGWYRGQKKYAEAEKIYKRVLNLQVSRLGRHYDVALTHNDLGVIYAETNRYAEAEKEFKEALELWKTLWDREIREHDEAVTHHNYATLLEKMGRAGEAKSMEQKAEAMLIARNKVLGY